MSSHSLQLTKMPSSWHEATDLLALDWSSLPTLPPFMLADGSAPAQQQTIVHACADSQALAVHFDCVDRDIWATMPNRDDPIYDEEVVELFLSAGDGLPVDYFEFELSPDGVLFDARIHNPGTGHDDIVVGTSWDCAGIRWQAARWDAENRWVGAFYIPWAGLIPAGPPPKIWRGNFYRIERPRDSQPEFSCWSPTLTEPANFHVPAQFGTLILPD